MSEEIRYGVIGSGMMGLEHINNVKAIEGARVVAVADPDPQSRKFGKHTAGIDDAMVFENHRDLLAANVCDAVVVVTPNHTHADVMEDVLAAGVHVLVEKPLGTTVAECRRILKAAEGHPGVVWMGLEMSGQALYAALIEGTVQLGDMSRKMKPTEMDAFEERFGYEPTRFDVALDTLAVFVHKDNPLEKLTLTQVDAIGFRGQREIEAIVHDEERAGVAGDRPNRAAPGQRLPIDRALGAQLHHRGASRTGRTGLLHRVALPARIVVGQDVKAGEPLARALSRLRRHERPGTEMSRSVIFLRSVLRLIPSRAAALI